jgi:hypothetical protein
MAENVKRRVAAARLAVAFVAAGTIAGATAWAQAGPPPTAQSSASDIFAKLGDIKGEYVDSSNIIDGSLKLQDFHWGQVPSFKQYSKLKATDKRFQASTIKQLSTIKGELGDVNGDISTIKGELVSGYVKIADADARYIKLNDAIMGDGSVFTATQAFNKGASLTPLADVPNLLKVEGTDTTIKVTNTSGGPLTHTSCSQAAGGTLAAGGSLSCAAGDQAETMQFVNGDGHVVTLNFSNVALPNGSQATVQILVGL